MGDIKGDTRSLDYGSYGTENGQLNEISNRSCGYTWFG